MDPEEIEFLGEKEEIGIIPNFNSQALHLICDSVGPFKAGLPMHVPLWLAVHLKRQQKCRIVPPVWMDRDLLEDLKEAEKREARFLKMPSENYMVISKLLFSSASDDVPHVDEIKTFIKDIYDIRMSKLRAAINSQVDSGNNNENPIISYTNLTMQEVNTVKPFLPYASDLVARLERAHAQHMSNINNSTILSNF